MVSLVPTSAVTGEGICDLLLLLVRLSQVCTQPVLHAQNHEQVQHPPRECMVGESKE